MQYRNSSPSPRVAIVIGSIFVMVLILVADTAAAQDLPKEAPTSRPAPAAMNVKIQDVKWKKMLPELGDRSPEIAFLHVDPKTQATQLLIRTPAALHVRKHWHSANETHTVISGATDFACDGKRETLGPGSFNYMPARMPHEAWTQAGGIVFITVDGPWDVNWVDGPPTAADVIGDALPQQADWREAAPKIEHTAVNPTDLKWQPAPPPFSPGAQVAVLEGDPAKPGPFTLRIKSPADYKVRPHRHPADEHITVISGALNVGMGDSFDKSRGTEIGPGGFVLLPAGMHHFAWTTQETVIQIHGIGPWSIIFIDPADEPSRTQQK